MNNLQTKSLKKKYPTKMRIFLLATNNKILMNKKKFKIMMPFKMNNQIKNNQNNKMKTIIIQLVNKIILIF